MTLAAVHQFHSGTAVGDAVTNQMLSLQRRLRSMGFLSEVYAQHIAPGLDELVRPLEELRDERSTLLLVHHSMGHTSFERLMASGLPMVTIFHSITPARFFSDRDTRRFVQLGFDQLKTLARRSSFGIADSNHNRQQMYDAGFEHVDVMPVRTDFAEMRALRSARPAAIDDWLFVGRLAPNKRQCDVVRAFAAYRAAYGTGHLHLVGDLSFGEYVDTVRHTIHDHGVGLAVSLHGKLPQHLLNERYRTAGLLVCLSEHEGFGVPLLEAMAAGLPVIARAEAAVTETMGGAGVLVDTNDPGVVAAAARLVLSDDEVRRRLVEGQDRRLAGVEGFDVDGFLRRVVDRAARGGRRTTVQIQGPFETSYSLAILNREVALGLATHPEFDVSIHATEGPGDYTPADADLDRHPEAAELYRKASGVPFPEVAIRQMFPPRVADSTAGMTFQYFGWEEGLLPAEVAREFDRHLEGIGVMSSYVADVLRDSGADTPTAVVGVGVRRPDPAATITAPELDELRACRFLHISSAFPRKGVDALIDAYFQEFTGADHVTLILKTFPNPHNEVAAQLADRRSAHADPPHVCWIDRDLDRSELDALYGLATAYVHAARGEGYGLPVAEAMAARVPVISVDSSGLADFVDDRTAAVIGHHLAPARSHVSVPGSMWSEPHVDDLRREMRACADGSDASLRADRVERAADLIAREHSWEAVNSRWAAFIHERRRRRRPLRVATVTTYNSRCGIAEYSAHLYEPIEASLDLEIHGDVEVQPLDPDVEQRVRRTWYNHRKGRVETLLEALADSDAELVHLQHNFGFFTLAELERIIAHEVPRRPLVITLHRTIPLDVDGRIESIADIADALRTADALIVHQESDRRRLAEVGVVDNVHLMLHGTEELVATDRQAARRRHDVPSHAFVVGTFGFLLPHKGVIRLVEAIGRLRRAGVDAQLVATCALHPDPSSAAHEREVRDTIRRLGLVDHVRLVTDFLDPSVSRDLLATADVLALPYEATNESASGALRSVLPLGRAIVTSHLPIFEDAADAVVQVPAPVQVDDLTEALAALWRDPAEREVVERRVQALAAATSWRRTARRTRELYCDLISGRSDAVRRAMDA
ncbi:MAG: glycosyltransferase [Ilumatobacteraceae bacterium]